MNHHHDHFQSPQDPTESADVPLHDIGRRRSSNCLRRLDKESTYDSYLGHTYDHPIVAVHSNGGNYEEGITHLLTVGEHVLAVSRGINRKKLGSPDAVDFVRVAILPVGIGDNRQRHSATTVVDVDMASLSKPNEKGVIESFRDVTLTRAQLAELTGSKDATTSGNHCHIRIKQDASIKVEDHSLNGTQIFDQYDVVGGPSAPDLDGQLALLELTNDLHENPHRWLRQSADKLVVENAQS